MSRIGKKPVSITSGVKASLNGLLLKVEGPKGKLQLEVSPRMKFNLSEKEISITRPTDNRIDRSIHGLTRSLVQNMVNGVASGYRKDLEIVGVGFKAQVKGAVLNLALGYSHPIDYQIPEGVLINCPNPTRVEVSGIDKQKVGQVAADIRAFFKPEPYKGKGIHYVGEKIRRKQGKAVG
jgi:large subunit ribosomal protein L6